VLRQVLAALEFHFTGYEFTSDAEECVDGSRRGRRSCVSQHDQDLTMGKILIVMGKPTAVLVSSLLVVVHVSCRHTFYCPIPQPQSGLEL
jgi:hypothetical protein